MMDYGSSVFLIVKSIHLVFVISYFAGIFYLVRLFIYHYESTLESDDLVKTKFSLQFILMIRRLWNIIIVPAGIMVLITGALMLSSNDWYLLNMPWMQIKLGSVALLMAYHHWCWKEIRRQKIQRFIHGSKSLRLINEVATLLMFIIVFAVVLKHLLLGFWYWIFIAFVATGLLMFLAVKYSGMSKEA